MIQLAMHYTFGIKQKFIALALALLVAVSVFVAWFFPMRQERQMSEYLNQKALVLAQVTAYGTASGMVFDDTVSVNNALAGVRTLPDVQFALAYNTQGILMGEVKQRNAAPYQQVIIGFRGSLAPTVEELRAITIVSVPIVLNDATHGQLILGLTREFLERDVRSGRMMGFLVSMAIVVVGGLVFFWQTSRLVRPIQTLEQAAESIAGGQLDIADVAVVSHDEIGKLTRVFNQMVGNLRAYITQIQHQRNELSTVNSQLQENNLELAAANEEIQRQVEVQAEQSREIELANSELQEKNLEIDSAMKELQAAQSLLVQSERMNAVGMLTAGVMHEINNPNAAVLAAFYDMKHTITQIHDFFFNLLDEQGKHTRRAQAFAQLCDDAQQTLSIAHNGAERVKTIVANLQTFTKHQRAGLYQIHLVEELQSTIEIFRYQFKNVAVQLSVAEDITITGNAGELNQVFLNLMVNAAQAEATAITIAAVRNTNARMVELTIADNGKGMTDEVRKHIFEAFFSTKGTGNSGLGLSISRQILEHHHAALAVESVLGKGTTFTLAFPFASSEADG